MDERVEPLSRLGWPKAASLACQHRIAPRASPLAKAGDHGVQVRAITSGWAIRYLTLEGGRRQIINVLLPGDVFGVETIHGHPVSASVQSVTPLTYVAFEPDELMKAHAASPALRRHLVGKMLGEKAMVEDWILRLGRCDAEARTAAMLSSLHARLLTSANATDRTFVLELTQHDMADLLGLHAAHLNRVLARLQARGLITLQGRLVTIHPQPHGESVPTA